MQALYSLWVRDTIVLKRVANVNLCSVDPSCTAVSSVGDCDGGDDVGLQQVHSPPRFVLFSCMGA